MPREIARPLLAWFARAKRDLPWRRSQDPYRVWVSEIMLQQTQVDRVKDFFIRFLAAFPDVHRLAAADEHDVLRLWEGLGYYRRARQMHAAAKCVVAEHGGRFPRTAEGLRSLPGIGRYTAGAIASIALDLPEPIVEANSRRVIARLAGYAKRLDGPGGDAPIWKIAEAIVPRKSPGLFNQALMDLGALVCTPERPLCNACPLAGLCDARRSGRVSEIPVKTARPATKKIVETAVVVRRRGRVLVEKRGAGEWWAGLWDFPRLRGKARRPGTIAAAKPFEPLGCGPPSRLGRISHTVTNHKITLDVVQCIASRAGRSAPDRAWVSPAKLATLAMTSPGRRIARMIQGETAMKRLLAIGILLVGCVSAGFRAEILAAEPTSGTAGSEGIARIAWDLVRASGDGNVVISPASVWKALAMTHAGARGETAAEIAGVLGMPDDREQVAVAAESLRNTFAVAEGANITLDIANRLWVQAGAPLDAGFASLLEKRYAAPAGIVDFAGATEAARTEINRWVGEQTAGTIDELMKPGTVEPLTRLVITNAVFFKAPWAEPFAKDATRPEPFMLADGQTAEVPLMHRVGRMVAGTSGAGDTAATVCEIPYAGNRLGMIVIVPVRADGLGGVLAALDGQWREKLSADPATAIRSRPVKLSLPRWTARRPLSLKPALTAMGMKRAFEGGVADFSGIDGTRDLAVTAVVHEGFVEVTEEGTEAAAATGVAIGVRSAVPSPEEPLDVRADRPFAWAIIERPTGTILFAGVVRDPRP